MQSFCLFSPVHGFGPADELISSCDSLRIAHMFASGEWGGRRILNPYRVTGRKLGVPLYDHPQPLVCTAAEAEKR